MSSERAGRHCRMAMLCGVLLSPAWVLAPTRAAANPNRPRAPKQDEACLACHGTAGMKSDKGRDIYVNPARHALSAHAVLGCRDCHSDIKVFPHPAEIVRVQCATCHEDEAKSLSASAHSLLGQSACASCHGGVHELSIAAKLLPATCLECHASEVEEFADSIHGQALKKGEMWVVSWRHPRREACVRAGFLRVGPQAGQHLCEVPQRSRFPLAPSDSGGPSRRIL